MSTTDDARESMASLEKAAQTYTRGSLQDQAIRRLIVRTFAPFLRPSGRGLQLGYAEGIDTALLSPRLQSLEVVEGCAAFAEAGRAAALPNVTFHEGLFEEFSIGEGAEPYDYVFAIYVLEHVCDVGVVLSMVKSVLAPGGLFFVVAPNARALSRQLARHMGLIEDLKVLTEHDKAHGHRRVYDRVSLNRDLEAGGFRIVTQGGIMLKILADFQLDRLMREKILEEAHIDGLYALGLEYPDLCGSLFAVCDLGPA